MIITLAEFKSYLGITDASQDALLNLLLNSANDFVESYIGRELELQTYTQFQDGNAQREILLENYPVASITSLEMNEGTLENPDYQPIDLNSFKLSPKVGKIFLNFFMRRGFQNYKIVYVGGYDPIPGDLKLATLKLGAGYYNKRTSDGIKSESVAGDSIGFDTTEISSDVLIILNNYRNV